MMTKQAFSSLLYHALRRRGIACEQLWDMLSDLSCDQLGWMRALCQSKNADGTTASKRTRRFATHILYNWYRGVVLGEKNEDTKTAHGAWSTRRMIADCTAMARERMGNNDEEYKQ